MQFNLTKPCKYCPFRQDTVKGWLGRHAESIAASLTCEDKTFPCHETTGVTTGNIGKPEDDSHCAGALLMLKASGQLNDNWRLRLAQTMKLLDMSRLKQTIPVFDTPEAFVQHHKNEHMFSDKHTCRLNIILKSRADATLNIVKFEGSELDVGEVRQRLVDCAQEWAAGGPLPEPPSVEQLYDLLNANWDEDLDIGEVGLELNVCGDADPHYIHVNILAHD